MLKRPSGSTCASCRGVSELLAGVLVTVEDIRLDAAMPSLPGSEIDVHFSARLGFTRRAGEVHHEFMRPPAFGNAASLPQELLQVEDLVGIADVDVHAAGRSGVAATKSPVSLSSQTPVCQEVLSPPSFASVPTSVQIRAVRRGPRGVCPRRA